MKRVIKEIIFAGVIVGLLALGVTAQGDQDKKPPKNPPVVKVGDKPPPTPRPKKPE